MLWFAYAETQKPNVKWLGVCAIAFWGFVFAKEISLWLLGSIAVVGVIYLVFQSVATLPVSVAIIVGALIIAGAMKK